MILIFETFANHAKFRNVLVDLRFALNEHGRLIILTFEQRKWVDF